MGRNFDKRIYDLATFRRDIFNVVNHLDDLRTAVGGGRVGKAFSERIMLAVTQVNGCRYCQYGHARAALKAGVSPQEIQSLAEGELGKLPPEELVALMFAQHYAETEGNPDAEAWQRLVEIYGLQTARDIMAYIRMIMLGNLLGNTFDALLSRFIHRPAAGSSWCQELGVLLGGFVLIPVGLLRRRFA